MPHLVEPIRNQIIRNVLSDLEVVHQDLVEAVKKTISGLDKDNRYWGIAAKRLNVRFGQNVHSLIGKDSERFIEVINMAATIERLIDTLRYFSETTQYSELLVQVCHPCTSDNEDENDIVLVNTAGQRKVICEVCDVASSKPGQNGKEKKDLRNLGCEQSVPNDDVIRFIATSPEFALALAGDAREWGTKHYRYKCITPLNRESTMLLNVTEI